ncbi:hypothetical protein L9F63_022676, partial [Diploptera punctata]
RRSLAPSQIAKRVNDEPSPSTSGNLKKRHCQENEQLISNHEALIKKILSKPFKVPIPNYVGGPAGRALGVGRSRCRQALHDPNEPGALVLYTPPELTAHEKLKTDLDKHPVHVVVDPAFIKYFTTSSTGRCEIHVRVCYGRADTQKVMAVSWQMRWGPDCKPIIDKAIVVAPSSLVKNWFNEINKWLSGRVNPLAIDSGSKDQIDKDLTGFMNTYCRKPINPILIISYETFRLHAAVLHKVKLAWFYVMRAID